MRHLWIKQSQTKGVVICVTVVILQWIILICVYIFGVDLSCVVILFIAVYTDAWNDSAFHTPKAVVIVHCGLPLWAVLL